MKNKYYLYGLFAAALTLSGCDYNEDHFPGFDELAHPTDVKTDTLRLVDTDYKTIAGLSANTELALSKDPEGKTYLSALEAVGTNKYFTTDAPAVWYLPAFVNSKYPYLDNNSKITVFYNNYESLPEYLKDFNGISDYELTSDDYKLVWGDQVTANFLSPKSIGKMSSVLKAANPDAKDGDMLLVNYAYSETEPSIGGGAGEEAMAYQKVSTIDTEGGNYVIVAPDKSGNMIPFGRLTDESKNYGYMGGNPLEISNDFIVSDPTDYVITVAATEKGFSLQRPDGKFIYQTGNYNSFNLNDSYPSEGGDWVFVTGSNGSISIKNVAKGKTVKLNEYNGNFTYGSYPNSSFGSYLEASMKADDAGFKFQDIALDGVSYVWKYDKGYGYWKAGAYFNNKNNPAESWLVSTEIDLSNAKKPLLSFDNILNHLKGHNRADYIDVKVSSDYIDDVKTASWTSLEGINWAEGNSWDEVNSGDIDLSAYAGHKIRLAFVYKSTEECAPTLEVYNIYVKEVVEGYYAETYIYKEIPESEVEMSVNTLATTRASVEPNSSAVYRYNASSQSWSLYSTDAADVAILQPADYAEMGYSYIGKPEETLPIYLTKHYPYAKADDIAAVVYYADNKGGIAATEFKYNGMSWEETVVAVQNFITFQKSGGDWVEAKVYLESSLLNGESGGFTAQDIELSGLSYVWTLDHSYGWKGTGYSGGNKATESWLVSSEIDLSKAVAPTMVFDVAINFLAGNELDKFLTVNVSTDYAGDATTATWETLEVVGWPEGTSWSFSTIEPVDLAQYVGKKIRLAFHYSSTTAAAPTVEIKNISIKE